MESDNTTSAEFSHSYPVISSPLWPHGLQHTRLPCPSPIPEAYSNSCPSSQWCHPTVSFSVIPSSSHLQSFPTSRSFPMSQFFAWGGQILEFQLQHQSFQWTLKTDFLLDGLISFWMDWFDLLTIQRTFNSLLQYYSVFSQTPILWHSAFFIVLLSRPYMTTGKTITLTRRPFVGREGNFLE